MPQNSVHVHLTPDQRVALDEFRRGLPNLPSKPEALRQALQLAIAARQVGGHRQRRSSEKLEGVADA